MMPLLAADGTDVYRVEFPNGTSIQDYLGGSVSVWCETAAASFGEVLIPSTLPNSVSAVDDSSMLKCRSTESEMSDFIATPAGFNCEPLNNVFQVRWIVENDLLLVELIGIIGEEDYMSFGVSGSSTSTFMIGADFVVVDTFGGTYRAQDFQANARSQCSSGTGVCPDTDSIGAVNNVNMTLVSGDRAEGVTIIRYKKPLITSDAVGIDSPISIVAGEKTFVVWAVGPVSPDTGNPQFHSSYPKEDVTIEFGRDIVDNCQPLNAGSNITETPTLTFEIPMLQDVTDFFANIGPSGGERGYKGITGQTSWGIAWYVNNYLSPILKLKRGTTYTFRVHGGDDLTNSAEYHPFYITSSSVGGYKQVSSNETVYAGIENIVYGTDGSVQNFSSPYAAPICLYKATDNSADVSMTGTFEEYFDTLDITCKDNATLIASGVTFTFTPNETTPDLLYYQCVTHRNLGWKIIVVDADTSPVAAPTPITMSISAANSGLIREIALGGFIAVTMMIVFMPVGIIF
jgi:DOMON domain